MNLSPGWVSMLQDAGHEAVHWSDVGAPGAPDTEILLWARANGGVVLTSDLDFTAILASTRSRAPSVVQLRTQDLLPDVAGSVVVSVLREFADDLARGALLSVDPARARVRSLPLS